MINSFPMSDVKLIDPYLKNAFQKEIEYLLSFDCDKLLSFFFKTKGLTPKAENYDGWENTEIRGHSLGHYLSAVAQVYATTKDTIVYERLQYMLRDLSVCQFENGYLSAFPEEFFDRVENGKPVWVPWYTMHKIISGLISVYNLTGIETAYEIVSKLGDWVYSRTDKWTPEVNAKVLSVEYGGMNDCMYELFKITKDEKHSIAAHKFDEIELFSQIRAGKDILNNRHANTTIPKFLGALNRYFVYGETEKFYLEACEQFWNMVVNNHSYITGGNSEGEHFGEPNILDAERTSTNCETCNTYNMLKLSRGLFQLTGDKKYANFYERTFINAILSSQNPETGMTMYFQPMAAGYFKVYGTPFNHFWCCTGTGMENFSKLNDSLYFHKDDRIFVNMYLSSSVNWLEKNVLITQNTDIPNTDNSYFKINCEKETELTLCFRIPTWSKGMTIKINDKLCSMQEENCYAIVNGIFKDNDCIEISFDIEAEFTVMPDNASALAFTYGPLVLSAGLGTERMEESNTGILVRIPSKHIEIKDYIVIKGQSIESWKKNFKDNFIKTEGKLEFRLRGTDEDARLLFTPHYKQHIERYGIYWTLVTEGSEELKNYLLETQYAEAVRKAEIDSIQIGNDQYELSHKVAGEETESGDREGFHYRYAKPNGWFSYEMKVIETEDTYLELCYLPVNCKEGFDIFINDSLLTHELTEKLPWFKPVKKSYLIPKESINNKASVTVKFVAKGNSNTARIADVIRTRKAI
jgi:DUF1680 family protein